MTLPRLLIQHRFLAATMTLVALLASFTPAWQRLENHVLSLYQHVLPQRSPATDVVVVAIDEPSLQARGPWPWPRDRLARIIDRLDKAGASAIGIVLPLDQPQPLPDEFSHRIRNGQATPDQQLAQAIARAGNVVLLGQATDSAQAALTAQVPVSGWASSAVLRQLGRYPAPAYRKDTGLLPEFSAAAAATARSAQVDDADAVTVSAPIVIRDVASGRWQAGLALQLFALHDRLSSRDIAVIFPQAVQLAFQKVATDGRMQIYPYPVSSPDTVRQISASSVLDGKVSRAEVKGKTVLLGLTAAGLATEFPGPAGQAWNSVTWQARVLEALEYPRLRLTVPAWTLGLQRLLLLLLGLGLIFLPAFLRRPVAWTGSLVLAFLFINITLALLLIRTVWLPLTMPALFLLLSHLLLIARQRIVVAAERLLLRAEQAYCELAANLQGQGQLDRAFDSLMQVRPGPVLAESLYGLGMDFERRRQFAKALRVYDRIAESHRHFRDIDERRRKLSAIPDAFVPGGHSTSSAAATIVIDPDSVVRPVIGRYEIEREIGHGAMGVVYLGKDPKIGRTVAIKTLSLTNEFESGQLQDVRRRFYQEAETAGKLHHPNIVTIYDVGEEHDLAFIAMDYVTGGSLREYIGKDLLLPVGEVLSIGARVAEALDYAHRHNVVHRDIKPENIMYDRDQGSVKVTDFGIACLTDNSKTRSGSVLGSPYYMSPEQISGQRVDGRSDLYSLGVTLFHLLTGELPFKGESLASLMYKITNDRPPAAGKIRKGLPSCVTRILGKALEKKLDKRYGSGEDMARALDQCAAKSGWTE